MSDGNREESATAAPDRAQRALYFNPQALRVSVLSIVILAFLGSLSTTFVSPIGIAVAASLGVLLARIRISALAGPLVGIIAVLTLLRLLWKLVVFAWR